MLRLDQIRLRPDENETLLPAKCAALLRVKPEDIVSCTVLRRAIDAREELTFVYTAAVEVRQEAAVLRRCRDRRVTSYAPEAYTPPLSCPRRTHRLSWWERALRDCSPRWCWPNAG